jgi:TolB protein
MPPGYEGEQLFYSELYVMRADGSHGRRITFTEGVTDFQPAWSPDGRHIVVTRAPGTTPPPGHLTAPSDPVIIDVATRQERWLTSRPDTWEGFAHWSPDGRRIAFEGDLLEPGNTDVYSIKIDGTGLQRLTTGPAYDLAPRYSPDGTQIVLDSDRAGGYADIFLMRANGSNVRQLTSDHASYIGGFSPDGRFLTFTRDVGDTNDVFRSASTGAARRTCANTDDVPVRPRVATH